MVQFASASSFILQMNAITNSHIRHVRMVVRFSFIQVTTPIVQNLLIDLFIFMSHQNF